MRGWATAWTMPAATENPTPVTSHTTRLAAVPSASSDAPAATAMAAAPYDRYSTALRARPENRRLLPSGAPAATSAFTAPTLPYRVHSRGL